LATYPDEFVRTNTEITSEITPKKEIYPTPETLNPISGKPDLLDGILRFSGERPGNWADPPAAGGADDWEEAVDAFAVLAGVEPAALPAKTRREWARVLREEVGVPWQAGPRTLADVIRQVPGSEFGWKTWASPHQAVADLGVLVGQHRGGGVRKAARKGGRQNTLASIDAFREKLKAKNAEAASAVDVEYSVL
jgi:hypothetical protein